MDQKFGRPDRNRNQRILVPYVAFRPPTSDAHWDHEPDCAPASWSAAVLCRFGRARVAANTPWRGSGHVGAIQQRQRTAALQNLAEVRTADGGREGRLPIHPGVVPATEAQTKSGRGLPHSKTWRRCDRFMERGTGGCQYTLAWFRPRWRNPKAAEDCRTPKPGGGA